MRRFHFWSGAVTRSSPGRATRNDLRIICRSAEKPIQLKQWKRNESKCCIINSQEQVATDRASPPHAQFQQRNNKLEDSSDDEEAAKPSVMRRFSFNW
jgi:hypothetical protein